MFKIDEKLKKLEDKMSEKVDKALGHIENELEKVRIVESKFDSDKRMLRNELKEMINSFRNEMETRLIEFNKEVVDKYFESLEKIFRLNKEVSLMNSLAGQVKEKDMANLRAMVMQPFLEARWSNEKKEQGKNIESKGEKIISMRDTLHNDILTKERHGEDVTKLKEQLKSFDRIMEVIK